MDNTKTLRELCSALAVSRRVIQGYEKAGLVSPTDKNKYGYLLYDEETQKKIAQIRLYQQFGFKVKEIRELMDAPTDVIKEALERQISRLKEERKFLDELIKKAFELMNTL